MRIHFGDVYTITSIVSFPFFLEKVKSESDICSVMSDSLRPHGQSMGFSRQEYWSGLPFPSPGDLPDPGIKPRSPTLGADSLPSEPPRKPWKRADLLHLREATYP